MTRWRGPVNLDEVRIQSYYALIPAAEGLNQGVLASLSSGDPWLVEGTTPRGSYLLFASDLDEQSTNLPLTAALMPLMEWMVSRWGDTQGTEGGVIAGMPLSPPPGTTSIQRPGGNASSGGRHATLRGNARRGTVRISGGRLHNSDDRRERPEGGIPPAPDRDRRAEGSPAWALHAGHGQCPLGESRVLGRTRTGDLALAPSRCGPGSRRGEPCRGLGPVAG